MPVRIFAFPILALACFSAGAAFAKDPPPNGEAAEFNSMLAENCLETGGWLDCIGVAAEACSAPEGLTGACAEAERRYWESRIDETLPAIEFRNEELDAADPRDLPRTMGFEDYQNAFIEYRNRRCDYESSLWSTDGSDDANSACMMRETGYFYLDLLSYTAEG